jgi:AbrB family looped-hinge helix DNA binding protein
MNFVRAAQARQSSLSTFRQSKPAKAEPADIGEYSITLTSKRKKYPMRITSKGQVTIPQEVREQAGLLPHTEVEFVVEPAGVRIIKAHHARRPTRGATAVERLRRSAGRVVMSTDEIMALTRGDS